MKTKSKVIIRSEFCKGCNLCIVFCRKEVLKSSANINKMGYYPAEPHGEAQCNGCMACTMVCPEVAIEIYGE